MARSGSPPRRTYAADPEEIRRTISLFRQPDQVTELRALNVSTSARRFPHTVSGYFNDPEPFDVAALEVAPFAKGVYFVPNPVDPIILSRAKNRVQTHERGESATADSNILRRRFLLVDVDVRIPSGVSSSDTEHEIAIARAREIRDFLVGLGAPPILVADSGNAAHVVAAVEEIPADDGGLIHRCLEALALRFSDNAVKIDSTVANPARIWKLYGTWARKGDDTEERPHRMARILESPPELAPAPRALLEELAAHVPTRLAEPDSGYSRRRAGGVGRKDKDFDLERWISERGLAVTRHGAWGDGGYKWVLNPCPYNGEHVDNSAYIVRHGNGAIAAGCHHNGCSGKDWHALRDLYEPGFSRRGQESRRAIPGFSGLEDSLNDEDPAESTVEVLDRPPVSPNGNGKAVVQKALEAVGVIVERAKEDPGAPFEPEAIVAIGTIRRYSRSDWNRVRTSLKRAGISVRELDAATAEHDPERQPRRARHQGAEQGAGAGEDGKPPDPIDLSDDGKPTIRISVDVQATGDSAEETLLGLGPIIFQRCGSLCRIIRDAKPKGPKEKLKRQPNSPTIGGIPQAAMLELASRAAHWLKWDTQLKSWILTRPPRWVLDVLETRAGWRFPYLEGIVETPTLRPDGSVLECPGYDPETGLFFDPLDTTFPQVPKFPARADAQRAIEELSEVFADFPFVAESDRSAAIAMVLSLLGRPAIDGPVPLFAIRAPTAGSGKGLLADAAVVIATGRAASRWTQANDDNEERKRLFSVAIEGDPVILMDNVNHPLGSAALDAALTSGWIQDRVLGKTGTMKATWRAVVLATGNNLVVRGDTGRRVIPIDLNPRVEDPEQRTGFRHPSLIPWVLQERPRLVVAGLTVLRAYIVAGQPPQPISQYGSFENWNGLVRAALVWAGVEDPNKGRERILRDSDPDRDALRELLEAWYAVHGSSRHPLVDVISAIEKDLGANPADVKVARLKTALAAMDPKCDGRILNARRLGAVLRRYRGRIVAGFFFDSEEKGRAGVPWYVERIPGRDSGDSGDSVFNLNARKSQTNRKLGMRIELGKLSTELETQSPESPESHESSHPDDSLGAWTCRKCGQIALQGELCGCPHPDLEQEAGGRESEAGR
jgi:hypothetical protein